MKGQSTFRVFWFLILIIVSANSVISSPLKQGELVHPYDEGLALASEMKFNEALRVWWEGYSSLDRQGQTDPRIGVDFIQLVTEHELKYYYGTASEIYMWAFVKPCDPKFYDDVIGEAQRLMPIVDEAREKRWKQYIKDRDERLTRDIYVFWLENDPRPTTRGNERLLEHWERISQARKQYNRVTNSVYDTDDRGVIFIKYGKPDRRQAGRFGVSSSGELELMRWIQEAEGRRLVKLYDPAPEYEVWAYDHIGTEDPAIFLFSEERGTGRFGLQEGIESLIEKIKYIYNPRVEFWAMPDARLEMFEARPPRNIPRDYLIYQIMYYSELRAFDPYFDNRYMQIEQMWDGARRKLDRDRKYTEMKLPRSFYNILESNHRTNERNDKLIPTYKFADPEKSTYEDLTGEIALQMQPVRLLSDRDDPQLAFYIFSSPTFRPEDLVKRENEVVIPPYILNHTLIIRDHGFNEKQRYRDLMKMDASHVSAFLLDHDEDQSHFTVAAEAFHDTSGTGLPTSSDMASVLAIGKSSISSPEPLSTDPEELELSDLVLGIDLPRSLAETDFPFPVVPAEAFARDDTVRMYVEIYHLWLSGEGKADYTLEYGISKVDKKGRKKDEQISMGYRFSAPSRRNQEDLSIDISKLKPGYYEFYVKVRDAVSGQEKTRSTGFRVMKKRKVRA